MGVAMLFLPRISGPEPAREPPHAPPCCPAGVGEPRHAQRPLHISSASAALLSADFVRITLLAFLGVTCLVVWHVMTPVADQHCAPPGGLWHPVGRGLLALCFKLNFMTFCILPMLLATSSDYGIYIVQRFTSPWPR